MLKALERAVDLAGGQSEFARRLQLARVELGLAPPDDPKPIKQQHVDYWIRVMGKLPAEHARPAERVAEGKITRHEFRADVFGPPPQAIASAA